MITVKNIIGNRISLRDAARSLKITYQSIQKWIAVYKGCGTDGFNIINGNHKYISKILRGKLDDASMAQSISGISNQQYKLKPITKVSGFLKFPFIFLLSN